MNGDSRTAEGTVSTDKRPILGLVLLPYLQAGAAPNAYGSQPSQQWSRHQTLQEVAAVQHLHQLLP